MKRFLGIVLACVLVLCLVGCNNSTDSSEKKQAQPESKTETVKKLDDSDFLKNMKKGLEARWAIADDDSIDVESMSTSEHQTYLQKCVDAEIAVLGSFEEYEFEDEHLRDLAQQYFEALNLQSDGVQYNGILEKYAEYSQTFEFGYNQRIVIINELVSNYDLTVSDEFQVDIDNMAVELDTAKENIALQEFANELPDKLNYVKDEEQSADLYGAAYYTYIIENTTEYTIDCLNIDISCLDEDGVIVYQTQDQLMNLGAGAKAKSTVYVQGDFEKMDFNVSIYSTQ